MLETNSLFRFLLHLLRFVFLWAFDKVWIELNLKLSAQFNIFCM